MFEINFLGHNATLLIQTSDMNLKIYGIIESVDVLATNSTFQQLFVMLIMK